MTVEAGPATEFELSFDSSISTWMTDPIYNKMFLKAMRQHMSQMLQTRGHLFVNELLDQLHISRTRRGQVMGWALANGTRQVTWTEFEGPNGQILIRFNTDGDILDCL